MKSSFSAGVSWIPSTRLKNHPLRFTVDLPTVKRPKPSRRSPSGGLISARRSPLVNPAFTTQGCSVWTRERCTGLHTNRCRNRIY